MIKGLRIGHLMLLNQFGSIPHDLAIDEHQLIAERGAAEAARHLGRPVGRPLVDQAAATRRRLAAADPRRRPSRRARWA